MKMGAESAWMHGMESYIVVFYHCGQNKTLELDPFLFSTKDSLHIHR
jgi:hypothetical protein